MVVLLLVIGVHCFEKKSLRSLAFSMQLKINTLFTRRGGILGALHLFITLLIIRVLRNAGVIHYIS